jgi:tetrahydromethanopterin S-methyltransferase subunit G
MENKDSQSRTSETQIVVLQKDIEHLQYVIKELEEQCEFVKAHFTTKNGERLDDIKVLHQRIDKHLQSDLVFHEDVRKKISCKFDILDNRIRHLERWKWAAWGGMVIVGTLLGWFYTGGKAISSFFG